MDRKISIKEKVSIEEIIELELYNIKIGIEVLNCEILANKDYLTKYELHKFEDRNEAEKYLHKMLANVLCFDEMTDKEKEVYFNSLIEYGRDHVYWEIYYDTNTKIESSSLVFYNIRRLPSFTAFAFIMKYMLEKNMKLQEEDLIYKVLKSSLKQLGKNALLKVEKDEMGSQLTEYYLLILGGYLIFEEHYKELVLDFSSSVFMFYQLVVGDNDFFEEFNIQKFNPIYHRARAFLRLMIKEDSEYINSNSFQIIVSKILKNEEGWDKVFEESTTYMKDIDNTAQYIYEDGSQYNGGKFLSEVKLYDDDLICINVAMKYFDFIKAYIKDHNMELVSVELDLDNSSMFTSVYGMIMK